MKGLSPNLPIYSSSFTEMHLFVMHYGTKALENFRPWSLDAEHLFSLLFDKVEVFKNSGCFFRDFETERREGVKRL